MSMAADISETDTPAPPIRTAFRSRPSAPRQSPPPQGVASDTPAQGLRFTPMAESAGADRDILMGYQVILGRDPPATRPQNISLAFTVWV